MSIRHDPLLIRELLDRSAMMGDIWERQIEQHPLAQSDPVLRRHIEAIGEAIRDLYQRIGNAREDARRLIVRARRESGLDGYGDRSDPRLTNPHDE